MAIQRHPVDSFDIKKDFWEEFPDYKIHQIFGRIWKANKKDKARESSLFMWALSLCYDRKSSFFPQPEMEKWEGVSQELFDEKDALLNFALYDDEDSEDPFGAQENPEDEPVSPIINVPMDLTFRQIIVEFEKSIDTPLGISLRDMERKLIERTEFIMRTPYAIDKWERKNDNDKMILVKGTADSLDKMFANTDKITTLINKALSELQALDGTNATKGGQPASLADAANNF